MILFRVTYFDPRGPEGPELDMETYQVLARNAQEAIKRANSLKHLKLYRPQSVELVGVADK